MKQIMKLRLCYRILAVVLVLMLASGVQLEATSGRYAWSVWAHIALGIVLIVLSCYHIYLHYKTTNWFKRFRHNPNTVTRILWWVFLLTAISGIAATFDWLNSGTHTSVGGVHGKIGFLMVIFAAIHAIRHIHRMNRVPQRKTSEVKSRK